VKKAMEFGTCAKKNFNLEFVNKAKEKHGGNCMKKLGMMRINGDLL
jgi:hypothetical protein